MTDPVLPTQSTTDVHRDPRRKVNVDATMDHDGLCAIAAVQVDRDPRVLYSDVLFGVDGPTEGETLALAYAMSLAEQAGWARVVFRSDHQGVVDAVNSRARASRVAVQMRAMLKEHPGWTVVWIKRTWNVAAHTMAGQTLKAWRAGQDGRATANTCGPECVAMRSESRR